MRLYAIKTILRWHACFCVLQFNTRTIKQSIYYFLSGEPKA